MTGKYWDQRDYDDFQRQLSVGRRMDDEKYLREIFNYAAQKVPTLDAALDWAFDHGIKFFIDRAVESASGYYFHGTGVVGIAVLDEPRSPDAVETLTHEIAHARQDYEGLMLYRANFTNELTHTFLREAEATAHGRMAYDEADFALSGASGLYLPPVQYNAQKSTYFQDWYVTENLEHYGQNLAKVYARRYGLIPVESNAVMMDDVEYRPHAKQSPRMNLLDAGAPMDVFNKLGTNFDGGYYMDDATAPDFIRQVTKPAHVVKFLSETRRQPAPLVRKILQYESAKGLR